MLSAIEGLLSIAATLVALPIVVVGVETIAAVWYRVSEDLPPSLTRPPCGILMPAHNESGVIELTLQALVPHLGPDDQVLVIADNCTDDTADVARTFPVTVIERFSETQRGKGYALCAWADALGAISSPLPPPPPFPPSPPPLSPFLFPPLSPLSPLFLPHLSSLGPLGAGAHWADDRVSYCTDDTVDVARTFCHCLGVFRARRWLVSSVGSLPEVVVVMDADCWFTEGTLDKIVAICRKPTSVRLRLFI